jgi:hypothetical protein
MARATRRRLPHGGETEAHLARRPTVRILVVWGEAVKRHPNIVWLVLCKTRRSRKWHVSFSDSRLPICRRWLKSVTEQRPELDHRLHRVEIPEADGLWIARKR